MKHYSVTLRPMEKNKSHSRLAKKAVKHFGTQQGLADAMKPYLPTIRQSAVTNWVVGYRNVSPHSALAMELATGGAVKREQFHPELYEGCVMPNVAA